MARNKSVFAIRGTIKWDKLSLTQKQELRDIRSDMDVLYYNFRSVQIKTLMHRLDDVFNYDYSRNARSRYARSLSKGYPVFTEWDLKNYAILVNDLLTASEMSWDELLEAHKDKEEEMGIAMSYISGVMNNSKIWKGHVNLLRNYKKQLTNGIPLTEKQAETLVAIVKRYSRQIVSNQIL